MPVVLGNQYTTSLSHAPPFSTREQLKMDSFGDLTTLMIDCDNFLSFSLYLARIPQILQWELGRFRQPNGHNLEDDHYPIAAMIDLVCKEWRIFSGLRGFEPYIVDWFRVQEPKMLLNYSTGP